VIGGLALLTLGAAAWLLGQLRRPGPAELTLPTPGTPGLTLRLRGAALAGALEASASALPEVAAARIRLRGRAGRLRWRAELLLEPGTDVDAAVRAFRAGPLAQGAAALRGLPEPALDLRLRVASPRGAPVRQPGGVSGARVG
jgi:hypothetical protein